MIARCVTCRHGQALRPFGDRKLEEVSWMMVFFPEVEVPAIIHFVEPGATHCPQGLFRRVKCDR